MTNLQIVVFILLGLIVFLHLLTWRKPATLEDAIAALAEDDFQIIDDLSELRHRSPDFPPQYRLVNAHISVFYWCTEATGDVRTTIDFALRNARGGYVLHYTNGCLVSFVHNAIPNQLPVPTDMRLKARRILIDVRSAIYHHTENAQ